MSTAFLAACVVGSPAAHAAAACEWVTSDLPLPAGSNFYGVYAASDNGEWVLGDGWNTSLGSGTFFWHNGAQANGFIRDAGPSSDVNNSGVMMINGDDAAYRVANGVRERLEPHPGSSYRSWGQRINNEGDVAGLSGYMSLHGPLLVWPAGSSTPRELPNTRNGLVRFVKGIDDDGNVVAMENGPLSQRFSHVWDRDGNQTRLETLPGDYSAEVESIRNGRIFGRSVPQDWQQPSTVVEWGLDGKIVRTLPGLYNVEDSNASGHVLAQVPSSGSQAEYAVWRGPGELDTPPGLTGQRLADNGDVTGTLYDENSSTPRYARCG
ncbi:hypothetical protein JNUCC0626_43175 [Lentzea sp. JNUCC 0626]|uniref:hypothetical protein n=1 Tax=Lentzea sp. JNUCC 0626 TaxID=3367513 RepID=UPI0037484549